ncbi:MAG: hypothetical protein QME68_01005 [Elusimicrobiota bacterium]|nr:hypothetical protein [Elusimicrobiota bacterium]
MRRTSFHSLQQSFLTQNLEAREIKTAKLNFAQCQTRQFLTISSLDFAKTLKILLFVKTCLLMMVKQLQQN